jgi:hypothetical protein
MADSDVMTTSQREIKFHEEQGAFPNEIWERGNLLIELLTRPAVIDRRCILSTSSG